MTLAFGVGANAYVTPNLNNTLISPLHLYVAPTGDDNNDGTSPDEPLLSSAGVNARILAYPFIKAPIIVHLASFPNFVWEPCPNVTALIPDAEIILWGDGAGQPGEDGFIEVATGTIDVGSTAISIVATVPMVTNAYQNYTLEVEVSGVICRRDIQQNTTNAIIPVAALPGVPSGTFRILAPSTVIDISSKSVKLGSPTQTRLTLINVEFNDGGNETSIQLLELGIVRLYGVRFSGLAELRVENCVNVFSGMTDNSNNYDPVGFYEYLWLALGHDYTEQWLGWGISSFDSSLAYSLTIDVFTGFICTQEANFYGPTNTRTRLRIYGGHCLGLNLICVDAHFSHRGVPLVLSQDPVFLTNLWIDDSCEAFFESNSYQINRTSGTGDSVAVFNSRVTFSQLVITNGFLRAARNSFVRIQQSNIKGPTCIVAYDCSQVILAGPAVLETDNGQALDVTLGGRVLIRDTLSVLGVGNGFDVTGGGSIIIGDSALVTWAGTIVNQLIVGPGLVSTMAAALPTPGTTYANVGGGSSITRYQ